MTAKTSLKIISLILSLIYIPIAFYMQWLILGKIQGTDIMYFIFWISVPLAISTHILAEIIRGMADD